MALRRDPQGVREVREAIEGRVGETPMYRKIADFMQAWETESDATTKVLRSLDDRSLGQQVTPNGRTLAKLAWHLVETLSTIPTKAGLSVAFQPDEAGAVSASAAIVDAYGSASRAVSRAVAEQWTDSDLDVEVEMSGRRWARGFLLQILLLHQAHHRGQMTVLMRQVGLVVPGVCGPSAEEWAAMGMLPQE